MHKKFYLGSIVKHCGEGNGMRSQLNAKSVVLIMRRDALAAIYHAGSGHPGGSLSAAELVWYCVSEKHCRGADSKFVLSKGHCVPILYAAGVSLGLVSANELNRLRKLNSNFQGHPHVVNTPWVETSTGSLGQGFSVAIGMAMGHRYKDEATRIYVMVGDGELQEGEVWEGAMCAAHYKLDNLCAVIDYNKMQSDDLNENIMGLEPLRQKWEAFSWHVIEIDGHDFAQIDSAFEEAKAKKGKPTVIIAHTVKGKGVSFMESVPTWHGSVTLRPEELEQALRDLDTPEDDIVGYLDGSIWSQEQ